MSDQLGKESQTSESSGEITLPVPSSTGRQSIPSPHKIVPDSPRVEQPLPLSAPAAGGAEFRAKFSEETHQYIREYIRFADQKATFIFAGATTLLAFLYQNGISRRWMKPIMTWNVIDVSAFAAMSALSLGALLSLWVIIPRLSGSKRGFLYWDAIAEYDSGRQYADELSSLSQGTLAQVKAEHCYELAQICRLKYRVLRIALWVGALGLFAALIVFMFAFGSSKGG